MSEPADVAIVGSGSIGVAFAVLFARAGRGVRLFDVDALALERAAADLDDRLAMLARAGLLDEDPAIVAGRVRTGTDLAAAVDGVALVQECAPERVELKREIVRDAAAAAPADAVIASSSSAITASAIGSGLAPDVAARLIVGHPGNPPYLIPVIEVVPSPATDPAVVDRARAIYRSAGLRPVTVRAEVEGFVFNRIQGAVLREAYALVRDGVVDVDEVDEIVRSGLGRRWSIIGPFETSDLNVRGGIAAHARRMGDAYARMGAERGQDDPWTDDLVALVAEQRRALLPLDAWDDRVRWRDEQLLRLTPVWEQIRGDGTPADGAAQDGAAQDGAARRETVHEGTAHEGAAR